jgi:hypothetical protein
MITYGDFLKDKRLLITLTPGFVLIMFSRMTIHGACLKISSYNMSIVEIEHKDVWLSTSRAHLSKIKEL